MKLKSILIEILVFVALCRAQNGGENFEVPTPTVEALQPKGFRIILKDDGYSFVGFRININVDFEDGLNDGQINKDNTQPRNGYWVYMNRKEKLNVGDTIYYWLYVIKNGMGHFVNDLAYEVTHFANENQTPPALNSRNPSSLDPVDPSCTVSKTLVQGKSRICKDALIFSEDFDSANLEELKQWAPSILFPGEPDYPFNVYDPNKTLRINGGSLVITPILTESIYGKDFIYNSVLDLDERCTGVAHSSECRMEALGAQILPPVITAKISTRYSFNFTYGRVEVRAKLPYGSWLLPEINLEPLEYSYGYNYDSGLMRIAFVRGNSNVAKKLYGGPVLADADPFRSELLLEKIGTDNWYKDYHNYTLIWKPDGLDMLVDGEMYGSVDPGSGFSETAKKYNIKQASSWNKGTIMAPLDRMFYVSLGLRVGGINDFDDNTLDDDGFSLFAFHGKLNEEMEGLEAGYWSRDITKAKNGRWTFRDRNAELKIGDTVYFWTYVIKNGLGFRQDNGEWTVTGYVNEEGNPVNAQDGSLIEAAPAPSAVPLSASPDQDQAPSEPEGRALPPNIQYPCQLSLSKVNVPGFVCRGQLLFEDNFNSALERGKIWTPEIMFPGEPVSSDILVFFNVMPYASNGQTGYLMDFPFNVYLNDRNLQVRDGTLIIKPITLESKYGEDYIRQSLDITARCTGIIGTAECFREASGPQILPPIITSKITTKNKFAFKYGRVEIRAKMPIGDWIYPEIQLEPRDHVYGIRNYASGVLRIATIKGNAEYAKKLYAGPIMCDTEPYRSAYLQQKQGVDLWSRDFHNYTLEWRPGTISLFVDGEQYGAITPPAEGFYKTASENNVAAAAQWLKGTVMAPFDDMFYVSIGLNVGGVHEFADTPNKPWTNRATKAMLNFWNARDQWYSTWYDDSSALEVDYVRVYAL
ncbi:unnamed protein product [Spodoptera exigua]|nr:unnamed protein product [Spodoptera exigua]